MVESPEPIDSEQDSPSAVTKDTESVTSPQGVSVVFMMLTLVGTRLAGGIVGVPISTLTVGYVFALFFQVLLVPLGAFSVNLLLSVREMTGRSSLSDIGFYCLGVSNIYIINSMIALANIGYPIIFFIVWGDAMGGLIHKVNPGTFWSSRVCTQGVLGILLIVLIIQRDISKLKFAGFVILT